MTLIGFGARHGPSVDPCRSQNSVAGATRVGTAPRHEFLPRACAQLSVAIMGRSFLSVPGRPRRTRHRLELMVDTEAPPVSTSRCCSVSWSRRLIFSCLRRLPAGLLMESVAAGPRHHIAPASTEAPPRRRISAAPSPQSGPRANFCWRTLSSYRGPPQKPARSIQSTFAWNSSL